ncbi:hypothetical protein JAAARDRAFT_28738 [Jaapia argillacea MUCL 33604]|uniref:PLP-dependent transferase n=1 Tax=Jaapia argillacea MUCL 33604 TaxID=933084 RepID=A0A067QDQ3_9AGAM|nr:hypothetical protein JAAARDRAFT_28738 [Jaapia argillacea MUCL 33604]
MERELFKLLPNTGNAASHILHRTPWAPPRAVSANGIHLTLEDGSKVIDAVGGTAVSCIGDGHPHVVAAVKDQVEKITYVFNVLLSNDPSEKLADYLVESSNGAFASVGFVSGGSEAMEAAMKTAIQYYQEKGEKERIHFIGREHSYHGATLGALAVGHHGSRRKLYEANLEKSTFHHVSTPYAARFLKEGETEAQYVERLEKELDDKFVELGGKTVIAFVAETVVGSSLGVVAAPPGYFTAVKQVCDKYGALIIYDEVMCGMGRMGTLHTWEKYADGVAPDISAVAKGLGGGYVPMGAVLLNGKVVKGIRSVGSYWHAGHTYSAHPLACAAALAVQEVIRDEQLLLNVNARGAQLESILKGRLLNPSSPAKPFIFDIRGGGLFWAIEFELPKPIVQAFGRMSFGLMVQLIGFKKGLLVLGVGRVDGVPGDHLLLAPAYNVTEEEVETIARLTVESIEEAVVQNVLKVIKAFKAAAALKAGANPS